MNKAFVLFLFILIVVAGCTTQKMICPAYQSAFLFDKQIQKETFFYFNSNPDQPREILASNNKTLILPPNDSIWSESVVVAGPALPKEKRNNRTRYLLLPKKTYKKTLKSLQTIEMTPVYAKNEQDTSMIKKLLDSAARSVTDTLTASSVDEKKNTQQEKDDTYVITIEKEKFNVDQDNYMWYFRKILVLPDVRIAMESRMKKNQKTDEGAVEKKGFFSLFKKIFTRKNDDATKEITAPPNNMQEEPIDSTISDVGSNLPVPKKKKSFWGIFKKKKTDSTPVSQESEIVEEKF